MHKRGSGIHLSWQYIISLCFFFFIYHIYPLLYCSANSTLELNKVSHRENKPFP